MMKKRRRKEKFSPCRRGDGLHRQALHRQTAEKGRRGRQAGLEMLESGMIDGGGLVERSGEGFGGGSQRDCRFNSIKAPVLSPNSTCSTRYRRLPRSLDSP